MDLGGHADGELLQRALDGEPVTDPGILELVAVVHAVTALDQTALAPRAEFVSGLRARLLADDATTVLPLPLPDAGDDGADDLTSGDRAAERDLSGGGADTGGTVSVLRVAARPLKHLAAAAASILVIGGVLGAVSRSAAPGDALYGIKQVLDRVAVQLADSRHDEGLTYLARARQHIDEAHDLLDRGTASPVDIDTALDAASDSTRRAQNILMDVYRTEQRADALTELSDFYAPAVPQVEAMRDRVPVASRPAWQRLRDVLGRGQLATLRELASCSVCGERASAARAALAALASASHPGAGPTAPGALPTLPGGAAPGASVPQGAPTTTTPQEPGLPLPGVGVTGGVTVPGGTVQLPGVSVTSIQVGAGGGGVTLPGSTVNLPSVGITNTGIRGGGVTLPGATVSLPNASFGEPTDPLP
jgi:hypothetical protein